MRIGIMGAGAIGGYLAARLIAASQETALVARGPHLLAIRERGLHLRSELGDVRVRPDVVTDDPREIGPVDLLLFTVKLYDAEAAVTAALPMIGASTCAATFQNGLAGAELLVRSLGLERTIGGTAWIPVHIEAPGVITHPARIAKFVVGSMAGSPNDAVRSFADALIGAGVDVAVSERIEGELWEKFVVLAPFSGVSAVTRGSFATIRDYELTRGMLRDAVREAIAVATAKSVKLPADCEQQTMHFLLEVGAPEVKASQTHDLEAGRRLELPWLSGAVVRFGQELGVPTPTHQFICAALAPYVDGPPG